MDKILESIQFIIDHRISLIGWIEKDKKTIEIPLKERTLNLKAKVIVDKKSISLLYEDIIDFEDGELKDKILNKMNTEYDRHLINWQTVGKKTGSDFSEPE